MDFNPDAYLAAKAGPAPAAGGFNPDAYLAAKTGQPPAAPAAQPSTVEALGRGALQGVSAGFSDEITGALESLFSNKSYTQARDEARAANAAAKEAHPYAYGGGEIAGGVGTSFVPGLGAAKGASVLSHALAAGRAGALYGLGASNADLTKHDFQGAAKDAITSALEGAAIGGAIGGIGKGVGKLLGGAGEAADQQAIKALAQGEGKAGAAWSKTRQMVKSPGLRDIINEPIEVATDKGSKKLTLASIAGKPAEEVKPVVSAAMDKLNESLAPIYEAADKKSGGVSIKDLINHLDLKAAQYAKSPGNEGYVKAIDDIKNSALNAWAPRLREALQMDEAENPQLRSAILKQLDQRVPAKDVRKFASTLQERGSESIDRLNPGLGTQVKRDMGSMMRDFVNEHVENVLGSDKRAELQGLNQKFSSLMRIQDVLGARADKEAAGKVSGAGLVSKLTGHGGALGAGLMLAHGNVPGAAAALVVPKVLENAPAMGRAATRAAAAASEKLQTIMAAADSGNPWARQLVNQLRASPAGAAKLAALERGGNVNQQ